MLNGQSPLGATFAALLVVVLVVAAQQRFSCGSQGSMLLPLSPLDAYSVLLQTSPLATKAATQSLIWGVGDVLAQQREERGELDWSRTSSFALTGLGSGAAWTLWYDVADALTAPLQDDAVLRTLAACSLEQFLFCPVIFATYQIPCAVLQNGGRIDEIPAQVQARIKDLLVANAKLWTPANILIYNVPLQWRVLTSNCFDLLWGAYLSSVAAEVGLVCEGSADDPESCLLAEANPVSGVKGSERRRAAAPAARAPE